MYQVPLLHRIEFTDEHIKLIIKDNPTPQPEIGCVEGVFYFINCPIYFFANNEDYEDKCLEYSNIRKEILELL